MAALAFLHEDADSLTLTFRLFRYIDGEVWNINTSAFEAWNNANWANYANATTRTTLSSGRSAQYVGNFPSSIPAGAYFILIDKQTGGSPAITDAPYHTRIDNVYFNGVILVGALPGGFWV